MEFKTLVKEPFCVIGKEIFTWDGDGLIGKVWEVVNREFSNIEDIILKDEQGRPLAKWGAMSSISSSVRSDCIWPVTKRRWMRNLRRAGPNGSFPALNSGSARSKERVISTAPSMS